jgi:hypothetical protein
MPRRSHYAAALTVAVSLAAAMTVAVPAAQATTSAAVIVTPAQARVIEAAYDVTNNKANATNDIALQDKHEEGGARALDDALFRVAIKVGVASDTPYKAEGVQVFVPRQTSYPAFFLSYIHPKFSGEATSKYVSATLFERDSAASTWKATEATFFSAGDAAKLTVDKDGYIPTLVPSTLSVSPAKLYAAWIAAQNAIGKGGKPSAAWAYNSVMRGVVLPAADVTDDHLVSSSAHFPALCLASTAGGLCFLTTTIVADFSLTPAEIAAGNRYPIVNSGDQVNAGGVALGSYTSLHVVEQRAVAIDVPRLRGKGGLALLGFNYGATSGRGTLG